jgi:hypothetical protein
VFMLYAVVSLLNRAEAAQVDRLLYGEAEDE